jgi:recombination protein RecR
MNTLSAFMNFSSSLLEHAVNELAKLPGIGKRTALRLAIHLLKSEREEVEQLGNALIRMRNEIQTCKTCHNISDGEMCFICANPKRNPAEVCVVQDIRDVMAIESTNQYTGVYHVLGGIISPIDGIGPDDLQIKSLVERVGKGGIDEIIFALPTTVEGDTTNYYLYKILKGKNIRISTLARGISVGDDIEYIDELTLGRAIQQRLPYTE